MSDPSPTSTFIIVASVAPPRRFVVPLRSGPRVPIPSRSADQGPSNAHRNPEPHSLQAWRPPLSISGGKARVVRAGVPEAAINEYRDRRSDKRDVATPSGHPRQRALIPLPQPQSFELSAQLHLWPGVLRLLAGHPSRGGVISRRANLLRPPPRPRYPGPNLQGLSLSNTGRRSSRAHPDNRSRRRCPR